MTKTYNDPDTRESAFQDIVGLGSGLLAFFIGLMLQMLGLAHGPYNERKRRNRQQS